MDTQKTYKPWEKEYCMKADCKNSPVDWISGFCEEHERQETDQHRIETWKTYREHFKNLKGGKPWIPNSSRS